MTLNPTGDKTGMPLTFLYNNTNNKIAFAGDSARVSVSEHHSTHCAWLLFDNHSQLASTLNGFTFPVNSEPHLAAQSPFCSSESHSD